MITIENWEVTGWEHAIRGMRNPKNSWDKSDSNYEFQKDECESDTQVQVKFKETFLVGKNDLELMNTLAKAGTDHAKYRRMIVVYVDVTAPLYWWKEMDTYKVGTVRNSCSTMHKIQAKPFEFADFSIEHLTPASMGVMNTVIAGLNVARQDFIGTGVKDYWWQMIQLLPSSYNQKATLMLNYEVLANIYESRKNHKLDEWHKFCSWINALPYSELITGGC